MNKIFRKRKIYTLAAMLTFATTFTVPAVNFLADQPIAEAMSEAKLNQKERERTDSFVNSAKSNPEYSYFSQVAPNTSSALYNIQSRIVEYNSDVLNFNDGKHDRWVDPVYIYAYKDPNEESYGNATNCGSAIAISIKYLQNMQNLYTYIRDTQLRGCYNNSPTPVDDVEAANPVNFIHSSIIATTLAHEMAHYEHRDWRIDSSKPKEVYKSEVAADDRMAEYIMDIPEFTIGSEISLNNYFACHKLNPDDAYDSFGLERTHPRHDERARKWITFLEKMSGGRIKWADKYGTIKSKDFWGNVYGYEFDSVFIDGKEIKNNDLSCKISGDDKIVFANSYFNSDNVVRDYFLGQAAYCMSKGYWHKANFKMVCIDEFIPIKVRRMINGEEYKGYAPCIVKDPNGSGKANVVKALSNPFYAKEVYKNGKKQLEYYEIGQSSMIGTNYYGNPKFLIEKIESLFVD